MREFNHKEIASYVKRSAMGDSDAFAYLYALTYDKVYSYTYHYLKDSHLAQDALQEIYIQALKNISKLNDPSLFIAWLNRISFNVCYDMSKSNDSSKIISPALLEAVEADPGAVNPEHCYEKKDEIRFLQEAINQLPFHEKQTVILRFYQSMKLDEIALAMSISKSSVKRYLAAAEKNIRKFMSGKEV